MKYLLACLICVGTMALPAVAEDVAVMKIRFGKEKELKTVVIGFYEQDAPQTVENFKKLARKGFYKGIEFHRAFPGILVQAGDPLSRRHDHSEVGTGGPGYTLTAEIRRRTKAGSVAMGRLPDAINPARLSNGSQFFITLKPMPDYNGKYTVFGEVISGLDVVEEISRKPTDSNDYPTERIQIRSVKIMPREKAGV